MKLFTVMAALALAAVAPAAASAQDDGEYCAVCVLNVYSPSNAIDRTQQVLDPEGRHQYLEAIKALEAKDFAAARRLATTASQRAPSNLDVRMLLGATQIGANDWRGAARTYSVVIRRAPADPVGHAGLGVSLAMLNDPKAQAQLTWLTARGETCASRCPDAERLAALTGSVRTALSSTDVR